MIIMPDFSKVYCVSKFCLKYSYLMFAVIPAVFLLYWLIRKTFVKFPNKLEQEAYVKSKQHDRKVILFLRSCAFIFIILAMASPFILESKSVPGNPKLTILVDNSSSMVLYDGSMAAKIYSKLEGVIPVEVRTIAIGTKSTIGDGILNNIESGENVLVISDGNNNNGKLLGDIMLFAGSINASVSTLAMNPLKKDAGVKIDGPPELIKDTDGEFKVKVNVVGDNVPYRLQVTVDDSVVIEQEGSKSMEFPFERKFSDQGYHRIVAKLVNVGGSDYFAENNVFYKSIKVVPRPKVLFVTQKSSPLAAELSKIYELDIKSAIPNDLSQYMAMVINDMPASAIMPGFDGISDYVDTGNGLAFIGGESSFESGGYKGTLLETLLPVTIGAGEDENKSDTNIVVVIDISHGTEDYVAVEKALALSVLDSLNEKNNVGAVAFNTKAYRLAEIKPLKDHKEELRNKIARLRFDGQSFFNLGLQGGYDMLSQVGGSKNIVFVSDGKTTYAKLKEDTIADARNIAARGVKIYVVGVGTQSDQSSADNNLFLDNIARLGNGIYFRADASNKLKVLFGEVEESDDEEFYNSLSVLDTTHFITSDSDIGATISGYNYVIPKPSARLLISTNKNIPILTVWRFGLGRVITLSTDDGLKWAGELLNKKNSKLFTKSINWAIGDLSRKKAFDVTIRDTSLGKPAYVDVVASEMPKSKGLEFAKIDTNLYTATYSPEEAGFRDILGAVFAVNQNDEFASLGISPEFTDLVLKTGGEIFEPEDTKGIIEFVKAKSKRIKINTTDYKWPFAILGLLFFLLDIAYRKIKENIEK
ncbi:VWA domain-containing protein [Candidatus Woesearchaeota archaeon]|nr:VWA domain-containing protein [Candidatus Woesearchaeota archaeon]